MKYLFLVLLLTGCTIQTNQPGETNFLGKSIAGRLYRAGYDEEFGVACYTTTGRGEFSCVKVK